MTLRETSDSDDYYPMILVWEDFCDTNPEKSK
jgi:hypothetical protein